MPRLNTTDNGQRALADTGCEQEEAGFVRQTLKSALTARCRDSNSAADRSTLFLAGTKESSAVSGAVGGSATSVTVDSLYVPPPELLTAAPCSRSRPSSLLFSSGRCCYCGGEGAQSEVEERSAYLISELRR